MRASGHRLRNATFVAVGLAFTALALLGYATDALRRLELNTVDVRFAIRGEQERPEDLIVVAIDDVSFDELRARWPFRRSLHAQAIDRITADRPRSIAYDVQFTEPSAREEEDVALAEAVARARGRVVLATTEVNERGESNVLGGEAVLRDIDARAGNALLPTDPGGVNRRVPFAVDRLESFAVAAVETGTKRQVDAGEFDGEPAWIDYYGGVETLRSVPFSRVARGRVPRGMFRDKFVVVGPSAPSLQDLHPTPTTGDDLMSGAEIQANAIATVRRGLPLKEAGAPIDVALILLLGLVAPVASLRLSPLRGLALAIGVALLFAVAVQLAFQSGWIVTFVYPLAALALVSIAVLALHYLTAAFERERVRDAFSRFVPEDVVDQVLESADDELRLGGVQREGTVMFTDLRGFTSFAEKLDPDAVIGVLNRYLSEMSDAILDHGGTLVAYMGDGIMAVFGAPIQQEDHADRALATAREMLDVRLPRFNDWLRSQGLGEGFRMGIGLNSGNVMSGNVGSERRMEYTAIGDTTNTAARLEGMTKGTPHQLYVADSTRSLLQRPPEELLYVDEVEVRGREAKIKLWSLPDSDRAVSTTAAAP